MQNRPAVHSIQMPPFAYAVGQGVFAMKETIKQLWEKFTDLVMLTLVLLILVLLFRVALGLHAKASSFTGEIPALPVQNMPYTPAEPSPNTPL